MRASGEGQQGVLDDVSLVRSVFDAIDGAGAHAQLQGTPYLEQLALYLVTRGRVTGLLATILEVRRQRLVTCQLVVCHCMFTCLAA